MSGHTPGPWRVSIHKGYDGEIRDCFVRANDVNGFAYDAEILGDDEYRKDAERWRKARAIFAVDDIDRADREMRLTGSIATEEENIKADSAIDALLARSKP